MSKLKTEVNRVAEAMEEVGDGLNVPAIMKPKIVVFKISGMSPLLQNNPANFIGKTEEQALTVGKKVYDDEEEAQLRVYPGEGGVYYHPTEAFLKSAIKAARGKKFGKVFAAQALMGSVFVAEPFSTLEDANGKPLTKYAIDRRSVVIGKNRVLRCRPMWSPWSCRVVLEVDTSMMRPELVLQSLALAGRIIGVGDYRPEKGGGFGRFTVEMGK